MTPLVMLTIIAMLIIVILILICKVLSIQSQVDKMTIVSLELADQVTTLKRKVYKLSQDSIIT